MVDGAPPREEVLPEIADLLEGRVLVAHNARFDVGVLRQEFERAGLEWPRPPVLCTVQLARRFAPLARKRGLAPLAGSLGIEVDEVHRALPDALTCARVFCALFPKLCANAPTLGDALDLLRSRRRARKTEPAERIPPDQRPDLSTLPDDPGVYVFRDERGKPLYVGKSVSLRSRARAHFCAPAGWTERAEIVDYRPTNSELGALVLENRLIKEWKPAGNKALKRTDRYCYLRCRLDIPYPVLEVAAEPAAGHAVNIGPLGSRPLATELADQLTSLYRLRHCGRKLKLRPHPSAYGQMGRCVSPCLGDLDPNAYRRQLDAALAHFERPGAGEALIEELDARMREASHAQRFERAAALLRRKERLAWVLERLDGMLRATHSAPRLVLARHPVKERFDAFWIVQGRLRGLGPAAGRVRARRANRGRAVTPARTRGGPRGRDRRDQDRGELGRRARAARADARPRAGARARWLAFAARPRGRRRRRMRRLDAPVGVRLPRHVLARVRAHVLLRSRGGAGHGRSTAAGAGPQRTDQSPGRLLARARHVARRAIEIVYPPRRERVRSSARAPDSVMAPRLRPRLTARSAASKPIFEWVLSQNGFVVEAPQRHSTMPSPSGMSNSLPSASIIVTGPVTL